MSSGSCVALSTFELRKYTLSITDACSSLRAMRTRLDSWNSMASSSRLVALGAKLTLPKHYLSVVMTFQNWSSALRRRNGCRGKIYQIKDRHCSSGNDIYSDIFKVFTTSDFRINALPMTDTTSLPRTTSTTSQPWNSRILSSSLVSSRHIPTLS